MDNCIFCNIIGGREKAIIVYKDKSVISIMPLKETIIAPGHLLIIPREHYENIYDLPDKVLSNFFISIKKIAKKLKKECGIKGFNLLNANGKNAQQSVFHLHFHFIPRFENDGLDAWPKTGYVPEKDFEKIYLKFKNKLNQ